MKEKSNNSLLKVIPKSDSRRRVGKSIKLWVLSRSWSSDKTHIDWCGVFESIERSVYLIERRNGHWVRYLNNYHPVHAVEEFTELLANARKKRFGFSNNETHSHDVESYDQTETAPFIYRDEAHPIA